eukprot:3448466-Amphidinium_carterae.1
MLVQFKMQEPPSVQNARPLSNKVRSAIKADNYQKPNRKVSFSGSVEQRGARNCPTTCFCWGIVATLRLGQLQLYIKIPIL